MYTDKDLEKMGCYRWQCPRCGEKYLVRSGIAGECKKCKSNETIMQEKTAINSSIEELVTSLTSKICLLQDRIKEAKRIILAGCEIMTPEQIGQWEGCRAFVEDKKGED